MKEWQKYEKQIFNKLRKEFPECDLIKNDHISGIFSKVDREVDVSIKGTLGGKEVLGVVECKHWNKNVDTPVIDSFIGFLEDVKANIGIIITNNGFSQGAINRSSIKNIHLDTIEFENTESFSEIDLFFKKRFYSSDLDLIFCL